MTKHAILIAAALPAAAGCGRNVFTLLPPPPPSPAQVSVQATVRGANVFWSAVEDATGYQVFASDDAEELGSPAVCLGTSGAGSPCRIGLDLPGQLYYVRVAALRPDFDPAGDRGGDGRKVLDQESVAVRPSYEGQDDGPIVWAGFARAADDGSAYLNGAWFFDPVDVSHVCRVYWGDDHSSGPREDCRNDDLTLPGLDVETFGHYYDERGEYAVVLEVESEDGRFGQGYTRMVVP